MCDGRENGEQHEEQPLLRRVTDQIHSGEDVVYQQEHPGDAEDDETVNPVLEVPDRILSDHEVDHHRHCTEEREDVPHDCTEICETEITPADEDDAQE